MQGQRLSMEDHHKISLSLSEKHPKTTFLGVFDGHQSKEPSTIYSGEVVSEYLADHFDQDIGDLKDPFNPVLISRCFERFDEKVLEKFVSGYQSMSRASSLSSSPSQDDELWIDGDFIELGQAQTDDDLRSLDCPGSTAVVVLIKPIEDNSLSSPLLSSPSISSISSISSQSHIQQTQGHQQIQRYSSKRQFQLLVAHVGDSCALLIKDDSKDFQVLTLDHKPNHPKEKTRILHAGGTIGVQEECRDGHGQPCSRVDITGLAMSRSFGDGRYKQNRHLPKKEQKVIATPDVLKVIGEEGDILLLCCDGLLERLTPSQIVSFIRLRLEEDPNDLTRIVKLLNEHSAAGAGSSDNHTSMIVRFHKDGDYVASSVVNDCPISSSEYVFGTFDSILLHQIQKDQALIRAFYHEYIDNALRYIPIVKVRDHFLHLERECKRSAELKPIYQYIDDCKDERKSSFEETSEYQSIRGCIAMLDHMLELEAMDGYPHDLGEMDEHEDLSLSVQVDAYQSFMKELYQNSCIDADTLRLSLLKSSDVSSNQESKNRKFVGGEEKSLSYHANGIISSLRQSSLHVPSQNKKEKLMVSNKKSIKNDVPSSSHSSSSALSSSSMSSSKRLDN